MNHGNNSLLSAVLASILMSAAVTFGTLIEMQQGHAQVDTNDIDNGAVTSPKIRDREVKTPDIADQSVTTDKIRDGTVETADIADQSVTSDKIRDGSITAADLAADIGGVTGDTQGAISQIIFNTCSIDFDVVPPQKTGSAFCPVPGAQIGDHVIVTNQDAALGLLTQSASVNGTALVRIVVSNPTFIPVDPPSVTWALIIFRT